MKKRNVLMMALSLTLVAVIAVGGTLAWMTASDDAITNTFQFGSMTVTLTEEEPKLTGEESVSSNSAGGYAYTNVVPGQTLNKEPKFSITSSVDAYVFVKVTVGDNISVANYNEYDDPDNLTGWQQYTGDSSLGAGITVWYTTVEGQDSAQNLPKLFDKVEVADVDLRADSTAEIGDVTIQIAAVQKEGIDSVATAYGEATFKS